MSFHTLDTILDKQKKSGDAYSVKFKPNMIHQPLRYEWKKRVGKNDFVKDFDWNYGPKGNVPSPVMDFFKHLKEQDEQIQEEKRSAVGFDIHGPSSVPFHVLEESVIELNKNIPQTGKQIQIFYTDMGMMKEFSGKLWPCHTQHGNWNVLSNISQRPPTCYSHTEMKQLFQVRMNGTFVVNKSTKQVIKMKIERLYVLSIDGKETTILQTI